MPAQFSFIDDIVVNVFTIPTDAPEADGTFEWRETTVIVVEALSSGISGIGYTYGDAAVAKVIEDLFSKVVIGKDVHDIFSCWNAMLRMSRNAGRPGIASHAIAAVDIALWDLRSRILNLPLHTFLGRSRNSIPIYGSGGFTSYSIDQLKEQLGGWVNQGIEMVKIKVGSDPENDLNRVKAAREAIGAHAHLFVDANGAYSRKQALYQAEQFAIHDVSWFEEPVSSDDLEGLRLIRDRAPVAMAIAAGEYGYDAVYFRKMLEAGAVDVLQADATRCGGVTGFLKAAALCDAWMIPLSAHTAPTLHAHLCCAVKPACHVEYFHDHARIEALIFEGALRAERGQLKPDPIRPGLGIRLNSSEAKRYAA